MVAARLTVLAALASVAGFGQTAFHTVPQAPRIAQMLGDLQEVRRLGQVALSPDGKLLAWTVDGERGGTDIRLAPLGADGLAGESRRVSVGTKNEPCEEDGLAWSPDSGSLAFLSNCADSGQADIYMVDATLKRAPRRLTHLRGLAQSLQWSPDGQSIGFLYVEGGTRTAGALAAMKPWAGVIGEDGVEIQRIAAVDVGKGEIRQLTPANLHVYEFDWSPDSSELAYVAAAPPGENNWWVAQLYTEATSDPEDEENAHSILDPAQVEGPLHGMQIAVPQWSPDGKYIAFIGGLMSDQGVTGGDLYLLPSAGGRPHRLTTSGGPSIAWFAWRRIYPGGNATADIVASEVVGGSSRIVDYAVAVPGECAFWDRARATSCTMPTRDMVPSNRMEADATINSSSLQGSVSLSTEGGRWAFIRSSFSEPPEVYAGRFESGTKAGTGDGAEAHAVTHYNDALKPAWGKAESVAWKSGSFDVQGWLLYPADYDPAKKYPLIVLVHGGPAGVALPRWPSADFGAAPFSAMGYFVLEPNPRGSFGQGEAFTAANRKDFGYGDLRDILLGVDTVVATHPIDPERIGVAGWSYGGFMTMFAVSQTHRFHAAVAGAGISNWQSYYGENSIDQWMVPYFGATVYDDPAVYAKSSPINFIHQVTTPTLMVVGDRDGECPAPQSFEFWHALRAQHIPAQLVVYPNEGHGFADPAHRIDVLTRSLNWFLQYMPPPTVPAP